MLLTTSRLCRGIKHAATSRAVSPTIGVLSLAPNIRAVPMVTCRSAVLGSATRTVVAACKQYDVTEFASSSLVSDHYQERVEAILKTLGDMHPPKLVICARNVRAAAIAILATQRIEAFSNADAYVKATQISPAVAHLVKSYCVTINGENLDTD